MNIFSQTSTRIYRSFPYDGSETSPVSSPNLPSFLKENLLCRSCDALMVHPSMDKQLSNPVPCLCIGRFPHFLDGWREGICRSAAGPARRPAFQSSPDAFFASQRKSQIIKTVVSSPQPTIRGCKNHYISHRQSFNSCVTIPTSKVRFKYFRHLLDLRLIKICKNLE